MSKVLSFRIKESELQYLDEYLNQVKTTRSKFLRKHFKCLLPRVAKSKAETN